MFWFLKTSFVPFIVLTTTVSIPRFQCKNRFEKRTTVGRDTCKNVFKHAMPNQTVIPFCFFSIISAQGGLFFKPIFALKPWDQGGRFGYNKRYKRSFLKSKNFPREPRKWPQKPKIAGKLELIGKKRFSFEVSMAPNRVESVEISHPPANFFILLTSVIYVDSKHGNSRS